MTPCFAVAYERSYGLRRRLTLGVQMQKRKASTQEHHNDLMDLPPATARHLASEMFVCKVFTQPSGLVNEPCALRTVLTRLPQEWFLNIVKI